MLVSVEPGWMFRCSARGVESARMDRGFGLARLLYAAPAVRRFPQALLSAALPTLALLLSLAGCAAEAGVAPGADDLAATAPTEPPATEAEPPATEDIATHTVTTTTGNEIQVATVTTSIGGRACVAKPTAPAGVTVFQQAVPNPTCPPGQTFFADSRYEEITVPAPDFIDDSYIGTLVNEDFVFYPSIDPNSQKRAFTNTSEFIVENPLEQVNAGVTEIRSKRQFDATVGAFFFSANFSVTNGYNMAIYRALVKKTYNFVLDTEACFTAPSQLPVDAVWYVHGITWGHSFYALMKGQSNGFGVGVGVRLGAFQESLGTMSATEGLELQVKGQGLSLQAANAATYTVVQGENEQQLRDAFAFSPQPVPIAVTFRTLPYRCVPNDGEIPWVAPIKARVRIDRVRVVQNGPRCGLFGCPPRPDWLLETSCKINGVDQFLNDDARFQTLYAVPDKSDHNLPNATLGILPVAAGQTLQCGMQGTASSGDPIRYGSFQMAVPDVATTQAQSGSFKVGNGNTRTEYLVDYTVEFERDLNGL